jgi:hypothetical protein
VRTAAEISDAMLWALRHFPEFLPNLLIFWRDFLRLAIANVANTGLALPLFHAMLAAAALCSLAAFAHVMAVSLNHWRAKVFISYEHGQENVAELITKHLQNRSISLGRCRRIYQYSLRRKDLLRIQFKGEIAAMHEGGGGSHLPSLIIQANLGRPILYLVGIMGKASPPWRSASE